MTPFSDVTTLQPDCLHLQIYCCHCTRCGASWTHSQPIYAARAETARGFLGGMPPSAPGRSDLPYLSYLQSARYMDGCFKCVVQELGTNWTPPKKQDPTELAAAERRAALLA